MKGDAKVIEFLNKALTNELTAINQYWLHYRVLDDWGVAKLAEYERLESIDEMKHADMLAERILFLNGLPNFQAIHKLRVGENVKEILKAAEARKDELDAECWTPLQVDRCLANLDQKVKNAAKAVAAAAVENNAVEAE
jgi:bacterioferritin